MTSSNRRRIRRTTSVVGATFLAVPLALGAGLAPAHAAVRPVDSPWGAGPFGYPGGYSGGYQGYATSSVVTDTTDATADQSAGLVLVTSTLDHGTGEAAGTGMVLTSDGTIVTNHHVVEDATSIEVTIADTGATYTATYVGGDATHDVAVLQLDDVSGLTTVDTDTSGVAVGDVVTSVGDANGDGGSLTAADGTVTDTSRSITVDDEDGSTSRLRRLIEVDADIVPGDSGGALLDAAGDVVGMNVAASSGTAQIAGYVIPAARVLRIADAIVADAGTGTETGAVTLGYDAFLGVALAAGSTPTLAGVYEDRPAAAAGLAEGDTVTAVGGTAVDTVAGLRAAIASYDVGQRVTITWTDASGAERSATVRLAQAPIV